ncbi:DNA-binding protein [Burkholderia gladioli]|uniref:DNA-binding protein n=1 Tax=Burkholderia gladioli TaxID=28095 RepID=UPI001E4981BC|nr:DNA-binding protein [Burkholderia gladioli]
MGTVAKLLQRWKAGQERQPNAALAVPPALQRAIVDWMDQELTAARATLEAELAASSRLQPTLRVRTSVKVS